MIHRLLLLSACLLLVHFSYGQIDPDDSKGHVILKWSPLSMFDFDNTVQFGVEVPVSEKFTIQQELGYGHSSFSPWYADFEDRPDKSTVKSRSQLRYYFYDRPKFRSYVAGEYLYKRVVNQDTRWIGMDCLNNGACGYFQNRNIKQGRFVHAAHAKIGWQFYFSNRTSIDFFVGLGFRQAHVRIITPNAGNVKYNTSWDFWRSSNPDRYDIIPSLSTGFHLGFALGRFNK